jgi:hypothetical protein
MAKKKSAKNAPKKAKGKESTQPKTPSRRKQRTPDLQPTLDAIFDTVLNLHARLSEYERRTVEEAAAAPAAAAGGGGFKHIKFEKESGSPDLVRVTLLDDSDVALRFFATKGESERPRKTGTVVRAFFEMRSSKPNDKAVIKITNAAPEEVPIESKPGGTGNSFILPLEVE